MKYKILMIEDDTAIQEGLKNLLMANGYEVEGIHDFQNILQEVKEASPHLILLDINLPYEDGFSVCMKLRAYSQVPIIFVTSRNTDMDELNSIMMGGDAFITKPYNTAILLAKIASLLKRFYADKQSEKMEYQDVILHLESGQVEYQGQRAELTKNELKIMYYLFKNAGKICPRADIVDFLWDNQLYVDDNALSVNITRIREKLAALGLTDFIKTKHRQGYMI